MNIVLIVKAAALAASVRLYDTNLIIINNIVLC